MKGKIINCTTIKMIVMLAFFNFIFLGTEYLFDNAMTYVTDAKGVVVSQSYILGASVIGFLLFAPVKTVLKERTLYFAAFVAAMSGIICIFIMREHTSYKAMLTAGCIAFILFGMAGSAVCYRMLQSLWNSAHLAKAVGAAYAAGILLQFLNNNFINDETVEAVILSTGWAFLILGLVMNQDDTSLKTKLCEMPDKERRVFVKSPAVAAGALVMVVILMTCIFAALDNAVTLVHASGSVDIGQWPRLLLACSGLLAGVLFDLKKRRYMNILMYCVTLLSTACVVAIEFGEAFLPGLLVFYLSAGFFVVFFTVSFMELACYMRYPGLWAGLGRAVNNLCAVATGTASVYLLESQSSLFLMIAALFLFALISAAIFVYDAQFVLQAEVTTVCEGTEPSQKERDAHKFLAFCETFSLTQRESEVLKMLLSSDDAVSGLAEKLFISRAALYRYITSLNEKTDTKTRIGLLQFYYGWDETDEAP